MVALESLGNDPYVNLSIEEALFRGFSGGEPLLYIWINRPSVIIGRNQNAWRECDVAAIRENGVSLVRRDTGGGAVYHDLGNLLFSFVLPPSGSSDYSYGILIDAFKSLGVDAELSGRNDMLAGGRKFSGSAYMLSKNAYLHHGTVLVDTDLTRLASYLSPSTAKMRAKGVESVRQRVVNLSEIAPGIGVPDVKKAIMAACGCGELLSAESAVDMREVRKMAERRASWDFVYGSAPSFDIELIQRLDRFEIQILLSLKSARVTACKVYTDALDAALAANIESALVSRKMTREDLSAAVKDIDADVSAWLSGLSI